MQDTSQAYKEAIVKGTRQTKAVISFGVYDITAKADAAPTASTSQPFTTVADIVDDSEEPGIKIATLEEDYFCLDGSFNLVPDDLSTSDKLGYWSETMSNSNKQLADEVAATAPTFTRNTVAYKSDGSQVANNVPRYEAGKFGNGIMIEEATTNILSANRSSVETDTTGFNSFGSAVLTRDTSEKYFGNASLKVTTPGVAVNEGVGIPGNTAVNAIHTGSLYIKGSGIVSIWIRVYYSDSTNENIFLSNATLTNEWERYSASITPNVAKTVISYEIFARTASVQAITFWVDCIQIEQKAFASSWQIGGTIRDDESFYLSDSDLFINPPLTVEIDVFIPSDFLTNRKKRQLLSCTEGGGYAISLDPNTESNIIGYAYYNGYLTPRISHSNIKLGDWNKLALTLTPTSATLYLINANGTFKQTITTTNAFTYPTNPAHKKIFLGTENNAGSALSTEFTNYLLDNFRKSNVARTQSELEDSFFNGCLTDESTIYIMNFENNLNSFKGVRPTLTILFDDVHTSVGLGIIFDEEFCTDFEIKWYQNTTLLETEAITGNDISRFYTSTGVIDFNKVEITFLKTNKPFRYIRILEVNFGLEEIFDDDKIISASIIEELDPTSSVLSINKLKVTLANENQKFNMLNPEGVYAYLQNRQPIVAKSGLLLPSGVYEYVKLGTYYLSNWKNSSGLTATIEATDRIGILDKTIYYSSPFWVDEPLVNVINHIINDTGMYIPFTIDSALNGEVVNGYIPIMSHREALQEVLLSIRGSLRVERNDSFYIFRPDYTTAETIIDFDTIIDTPVIEQEPLVTTVEAKELTYVLNSSSEQLHQSTFVLNGTNTIVIPYGSAASNVSLVVTGNGTVSGSPAYSATSVKATIIGTGSLTVTVTGKKYIETSKVVTANIPILPAGQLPQKAVVEDNKLLCGTGKAQAVAQYLLDYYQKRIKQTLQYWVNPSLQSGDCIEVQTIFNENKTGIIERQDLTFSPNLKSKIEVIG